ncbi:MAG TPA: NAD-dependent epimerase/dehydratase family protein [Gemmatimonadaceae bacterium]|nr:NAD-dependent epimerase/dehydratase family protein [Gemmatimonadaceae bacterium]
MPLALVTGATGQVGSYIVERLRADGWRTRALVRTPAAAEWLAAEGVELARGDVLDAASFRDAAAGCDAIFHAAAVVTARGGWELYRDANVGGTHNAIEAASASGARLLHVSSVAVYGGAARYRDRPTDESTPLAPLPERAFYARSKRESERLVLDAHASGRIWAAAVRPDVIYGRRDRQFVPRLARVLEHGFFPVLNGGVSTLAIVHAASVADGAVRAVGIDAAGGQAYNLANDFPVTVADFARLAGEGLGRRVRLVSFPTTLARAALAAVRGALRAVGSGAMAAQSSGTLDFLSRDNPFTSERARRELGWSPPVRPEIGVPDAFRWWKEHHPR